jgi:KDO2-lipid IV(A) lauroyltransferase
MKKTITTRTLLTISGSIPLAVRREIFKAISPVIYHFSPARRRIAMDNLRCAYPEKSAPDLIKIAKGVYRNIGIVAAEFFQIPSLTRKNIHGLVDCEGLENLSRAMTKNKGLLLFTAHLGNWELTAALLALLGQPLSIIYRPLDSQILENLVTCVRACKGNKPVPKDRAMMQIFRSIKKNEIVGTLLDQNMTRQQGVFVDFFGKPSCTANGLAILALHTEAPVIPAFMVRMQNGKYRFVIGKEVEVINTGNLEADIFTNTQNFTRIIEDFVRRYPDQWLWIHQRWRTKKKAD